MKTFTFQNWPVYECALDLVLRAHRICDALPRETTTSLREQLRRASQSIPLNIAEGSSRFSVRDKAQFFRVARGSVFECVAIVDIATKLQIEFPGSDEFHRVSETVGKMLSGLIGHVEANRVKDKPSP